MSAQQKVGAASDLPPGTVVRVGRYAVGNAGGRYFAVTRRCRHLVVLPGEFTVVSVKCTLVYCPGLRRRSGGSRPG